MVIENGNGSSVSSKKIDDVIRVIMVASLIVILSGTVFFLVPSQPGLPMLDPLPPSEVVPTQDSFWESAGNLSISARIICDVSDTHRADRFEVTLNLRINNTGTISIVDFHPVKLSIFREDHWHYYTFGLVPSTNTTIEAFSKFSLSYEGDRILNTIEGITPNQGSITAYGRVLISFWNHETIVTTSLFRDFFPIE